MLVSDPVACAAALRRLIQHEAAVFTSADETFRFLVRGSPDDLESEDNDTKGVFEVCVVADAPQIRRVCENSCTDGYLVDEDDLFVLDEFYVDTSSPDNAKDFMEFLNAVHAYVMCGCGQHFVKDPPNVMCVSCHMTLPPLKPPGEAFECPVCYERVDVPRWIHTYTCCKQRVCTRCAARVTKCPMCRKEQ